MAAEKRIPLHDLREATNGFSVDSRIGQGGYGDVYKGVYNGREVAVKLLHVDTVQGIDDQQYINEVGNLLRAEHPNIVQLLGYSYETVSKLVEHNGKEVLGKHIYRVLCFEYLQGGSLDVCLREKSLAPDWSTRYYIIKGICEGLNFLHGCKPAIFHLDLKPANILLDNAMVPKVADFGLSRVISQSHTQVTKQIRGTQAYMPPEFINGGNISHKNDVFSLGVLMIEIMTESSGYSSYTEMDEVVQFKQKVNTDWKNMINVTSEYPLEELHQVQTCIDTAMRCVEPDRDNRPTIAEVLDILNKTETHIPKKQIGRRQDKDATFFTMHDLVHDLAKEILAHQIDAGGNKCRYALLTDCSKSLRLLVTFPANIRALYFRDCGKRELCGDAFSPAKCLRILDLSECFIKKLPDCIGQLKQLRFLHAPGVQDDMIPNCITELFELNYLNFRDSPNISALPESIGDMKGLMHLDLSDCNGILELPISFVGLKQLVHLDLSHCRVSISEAFGGFTKLQYLNLAGETIRDAVRGLSKVIGNLSKLRKYWQPQEASYIEPLGLL